MTRLDERKSKLVFTTSSTIRERGKLREIVLEPKPHYMIVRLKGCRLRLVISNESIFNRAAEIKAAQDHKEREEARKLKRKGVL